MQVTATKFLILPVNRSGVKKPSHRQSRNYRI